MADLTKATRLDPKLVIALRDLAWLLSACPETRVRDGKKAIELAMKANELTGEKDIPCIGVLAAAYAEAGQFQKAVKTAQKGLELASTQEVKDRLQADIALYEAGKPFRLMKD